MNSHEPDEIDVRILNELRSNARISHAQLGVIVRLSRNAIRQRIGRLERDGLIRGYTIVEGGAAAASRVSATMLIDRVDRIRGAEVISALRAIPEVVRCDVVAGKLDLIARVEAADPARIQEIWRRIADLDGVADITTAMALHTAIDRDRTA